MPSNESYFFALVPEKQLAKEMISSAQSVVGVTPVRWLPIENIHMTLAFLGLPEPDVIKKLPLLASKIKCSSFDLTLSEFHYQKRRRMLWLKPEEVPAALSDLVTALWNELKPYKIFPSHNDFLAHITLTRSLKCFEPVTTVDPIFWHNCSFSLLRGISTDEGRIYQEVFKVSCKEKGD